MRIEVFTAGSCVPAAGGIGIFGCVEKVDGKVVWTDSGHLGRNGGTLLRAKFGGAVCGLRKLTEEHRAHPDAALALYLDDRQTTLQLRGLWSVGKNEAHFALWREAQDLFFPLDKDRMYFNWIHSNLAAELVRQTMRRYGLPEQESRRA
jgi:hypothetical protein